MSDSNNTAPDTTAGPFNMVAYLLYSVRHSLEVDDGDRPPRWVRIARVREAEGGTTEGIGKGVKSVLDGFVQALSWMNDITLEIQAVLIQTDAVKALAELTLKFLQGATDSNFQDGIRALTNNNNLDLSAVDDVNTVLQDIEGLLDYIPEPGDLVGLGHEIYRMLSIVQRPLPPRNPNVPGITDDVINYPEEHVLLGENSGTGKLRLLQWSLGLEYPVRGLQTLTGTAGDPAQIKFMGMRRLWDDSVKPNSSKATWARDDLKFEAFQQNFAGITTDIEEANDILDDLGYRYFDNSGQVINDSAADRASLAALAYRLQDFQMVNDLPVTGQLDNHTLNRLINLDYACKNVARAKPYDPAAIVVPGFQIDQRAGMFPLFNGDAESPINAPVVHTKPPDTQDNDQYNIYKYYKVGTEVSVSSPAPDPVPQGWITDNRGTIVLPHESGGSTTWSGSTQIWGFIGMQSRRLLAAANPDQPESENRRQYDHVSGQSANLSEGESASGTYFFSSRGIQPWVPGRYTSPPPANSNDSLFGSHPQQPPTGTVSQIYQWVDLQQLHNLAATITPNAPALYITASVLQRSLFRERSVDQGRLRIEAYDDAAYTNVVRPTWNQSDTKPEFAQSPWYPSSEVVDASVQLSNKTLKRNWVFRTTPALLVPSAMTKLLIVLEGKLVNGYDIDAYFDDIQLRWEFRDAPQP